MSAALRTFAIATSVLLACATWAAAGPYYDVVTQDAPIGYWRLGEAPGSPVYPAEGGAQDATVNDRDLTYVNFNSASDLGKPGAIARDFNTAVQFNAAAGAYLERRLGASTSDFAFASGQSFAIEYWIKTTQTTAGAPVVGKGYDTTDTPPWYLMRINDPAGKVDLFLRPGDKRAISTTTVTDGQWHHVVGVYDTRGGASTTDGVVKIYVDGTLEATTGSVVDAAYGTNSRNLVFGRHATTRYFDGQADELAIYGQALDSGQVWLHNRVGRSGQVPNYTSAVLSNPTLRGYFPLGESANGVEAADASGRRNHMPYNPPERPTGGSPGIPGMLGDTAYAFDGVNDVLFNANYASTGYDPDFSFASGQSFSLELWVNTTQAPAPGTNVGLVTKGYDSATAYLPWYLMRMDAAGRPDIYVRNALSQNGNAIATTAINDGQWHHLVGVYDASANQVRMFVDGGLEASASAPLGAYGTNNAPLLYGRHGGRVYQGLMDETAVYASALQPAEISRHNLLGRGVTITPYMDAVMSASNLVGYWRFSESPAAVRAQDDSGLGNHMPFGGKTVVGIAGINPAAGGAAVAFRAANQDFLSAGDDADFEFAAGQSFSIEYWMRTTQNVGPSNNVGIVTKGYDSSSGTGFNDVPWYLMRLGGAGTGRVDFFLRSASGDRSVDSQIAVNDGQWHHVVGVYDAAAAQISMYIDGILRDTEGSVPQAAYGTNNSPLVFGRHIGRYFDGVLDEIAIYRSALSGQEIAQHYLLGVPEPATWALLSLGVVGLALCRSRRWCRA